MCVCVFVSRIFLNINTLGTTHVSMKKKTDFSNIVKSISKN